jgi:hypothetical protein
MANLQETLKFRITLESEFWDRPPEFQVLVDNVPVSLEPVVLQSGVSAVFEFEQQLTDGDHTVGVRLLNKRAELDTVMDGDRIVKDQLLTIKEIVIDDVNLFRQLYGHSEYHLDEPWQGQSMIPNQSCMGWNGVIQLKFSTPYYFWLIENL